MLFSTPLFIVGFLPAALAGFLACGRCGGRKLALAWLFVASLVFYAWWNPLLLPLLLVSIGVNFGLARYGRGTGSRAWLVTGVVFNLGLLGFFKYSSLVASLLGHSLNGLILPLGISFFTFQQIMYLVDSYGEEAGRHSFLEYGCFVAFFPHLISGPIVRPSHIIPQFQALQPCCDWRTRVTAGLEYFALGLAKKLVLADSLARFADPGFTAAARHDPITLVEAWSALLAYGLQIYFDFSGYSDMAIGLARMFGITFPVNFNSPYRAKNISQFWRCWNVTLSGFLRDYLYIPLGGNRHGEGRRIVNLAVTMLLGGLWHGAALRFLLWGGLHGAYLIVHGWFQRAGLKMPASLGWAVTLLAVLLAWVPFRSENFVGVEVFYAGLAGLNGFALPAIFIRLLPCLGHFAGSVPVLPYLGDARTLSLPEGFLLIGLGWLIVLALPALQDMNRGRRTVALVASVALSVQALFFAPVTLPFLYFQF